MVPIASGAFRSHDCIPWGDHVNYAASKGGTTTLMCTLAQEFAPRGLRVNAIDPAP
ncbi:SDR family NAD(P)-dependent oxidoreductase [Methylobacterium sp. WL6]|nr:SDR family NAD(P)-dependent oxidoreductase [Methylobacterium sp. WL6]